MTRLESGRWRERLHDALVLLLPAARPWCWDGAPGQPADLAWQALAVFGFLLVAAEHAAGRRPRWRWGGWRGIIALALVAALLPAALIAPEPAPAWCRWSGWVACLAAAAYLLQTLPGRERLAWAGLATGLAVTAALAVTQPLLVLPAMRQALEAGSPAFAAVAGDGAAIAERLAHGGAFATFTLANHLAAYLALLAPLAAGSAWSGGARGPRLAAGLLACLALAALAASAAKGGWVALALGAGWAWWWAWRGRPWRWLPLPILAAGGLGLWLSQLADASIAVRLGYWRAALTLAAEAPLGLGGYGAHQARVLLPGEEPTRYAHNEVLEAAVAGGWGLAALAVAALVALAWPRRAPLPDAVPAPPPARLVALVPALAVPYLAILGAFAGNLGWWPGGQDLLGQAGWSLVCAALAAGTAWSLARAPLPPPAACTAGLAAVAATMLIDFNAHAGGVLGTALCVAVLAGASAEEGQAPTRRIPRALPLLLAVAAAAAVSAGALVGSRLAEAERLLAEARMAEHDAEGRRWLAAELGLEPEAPPRVLRGALAERVWNLAAGAPQLRAAALAWWPPGPEQRARALALWAEAPHSPSVALSAARAHLAVGERAEALRLAAAAVRLAPSSPRVLLAAAEVAAAAGDGAAADAWRREAERLAPLVHPALRLPPGTGPGAPP